MLQTLQIMFAKPVCGGSRRMDIVSCSNLYENIYVINPILFLYKRKYKVKLYRHAMDLKKRVDIFVG